MFVKSLFRLHRLYSNTASATVSSPRSAWLKSYDKFVDIECIFINKRVQSLLKSLTGLDLEGKIFAHRKVLLQQRSHYALMNDEMLQEYRKKMESRGKRFLQFVPVKEPRPDSYTVLSRDDEIRDFDTSKFVFTDVTFDATNQDRIVIVREPDGTLRTALPSERDRMNRLYYSMPDCPVNEPPLFSEPHFSDALKRNMHEYVLDYACYFFDPDNARFVETSLKVFDDVVESNKYDLLYSTRHFGPLLFYLTLNDNLAGMENYFKQRSKDDPELSDRSLRELEELRTTIKNLCDS